MILPWWTTAVRQSQGREEPAAAAVPCLPGSGRSGRRGAAAGVAGAGAGAAGVRDDGLHRWRGRRGPWRAISGRPLAGVLRDASRRGAGWSGLRELQQLAMTRSHASQIRRRPRPLRQREVQEQPSRVRTSQRVLLPLPPPPRRRRRRTGSTALPVGDVRGRTGVRRSRPTWLRRDLRRDLGQLTLHRRPRAAALGAERDGGAPPCERIAGTDKRVIAVVGRFQRPRPNVPYKAQGRAPAHLRRDDRPARRRMAPVMAGATTPDDAQWRAQ